jgi:hypothetical protein
MSLCVCARRAGITTDRNSAGFLYSALHNGSTNFIMGPRKDSSESCDSVLGFDAVKKYVGVNVSWGGYATLVPSV